MAKQEKTPHPLDAAMEILEREAIHAAIDDEVLTRYLNDDSDEGRWSIEIEAEDVDTYVHLTVNAEGEDGDEDQMAIISLSPDAVTRLIAMLSETLAFAGKAIS